MKLLRVNIGTALVIVGSLYVNSVFAQQAPSKRNYEAAIQAALESAKTAAGFEHSARWCGLVSCPRAAAKT